ncbi:MAG TPA: metalloregulator ArsR/SmtB family transcription factor [Candidatus Saccharimonadales bacterium]|jgi:DNA-binding transcriptional ArsR family regulator|nr:metalloregulator ArsR/SmtB family transcription factor [Candidatus Saccharimonadales bacterium]
MVEYKLQLDSVFGSLADPTRRDILQRVSKGELSVSEVALPYRMTLAAISKHLKILETAHLISKHRRGRQQFVQLSPTAFRGAADYLQNYESIWNERFDSLEHYLKKED